MQELHDLTKALNRLDHDDRQTLVCIDDVIRKWLDEKVNKIYDSYPCYIGTLKGCIREGLGLTKGEFE